jgi:hypothetical protein
MFFCKLITYLNCSRDEPHTYYPPVVQVVPVAPEKPQSRKPHGKEAAYSPRQPHEEHKPQTQGKHVGRYIKGKKVMVSSGSSVPASQRYTFYRQYGMSSKLLFCFYMSQEVMVQKDYALSF